MRGGSSRYMAPELKRATEGPMIEGPLECLLLKTN